VSWKEGWREKITDTLCEWGFVNIWRNQIHGPAERLRYRERKKGTGCIFNTRSGTITIGSTTIIGHSCMFLTGRHLFENGQLKQPRSEQVPEAGFDITVGEGCWIASGAVVLGGVTLGDHCLVCAGAVVTKSFPDHSVVAGIPAQLIRNTHEL